MYPILNVGERVVDAFALITFHIKCIETQVETSKFTFCPTFEIKIWRYGESMLNCLRQLTFTFINPYPLLDEKINFLFKFGKHQCNIMYTKVTASVILEQTSSEMNVMFNQFNNLKSRLSSPYSLRFDNYLIVSPSLQIYFYKRLHLQFKKVENYLLLELYNISSALMSKLQLNRFYIRLESNRISLSSYESIGKS